MGSRKLLVVNADDFGFSPGVNHGVITAYSDGIVTSTSMMTRWPAAPEAASLARQFPQLGIGLHLDLGEWAFRGGEWIPIYHVVDLEDEEAVIAEFENQLATFRQLVGRSPTHLDSHQHVHLREPGRSVVVRAGHSLGIPVRHFTPSIRYCGDFYGQTGEGQALPGAVSVDRMVRILADISLGVTELACHPATDAQQNTMYATERVEELRTLCDPHIRRIVSDLGIELRSFGDLAGAGALFVPDSLQT